MNEFIRRELKLGCFLAPINIPIGIVIAYLVTALIVGSFNDAFTFTAFSIICTAGLSLILWLPIWYWVGYAVVILLRFALSWAGLSIPILNRGKAEQAASQNQPAQNGPTLSRDQQALLSYIKKAQTKGLSDEQISTNLTNSGWASENIRAALRLAQS